MMTSVRAGTGVPVTLGPVAPPLHDEHELDPIGWHDIEPLQDGSMRRRRLIDVHVARDSWAVSAMFRDTHVQPGGNETVLHEYTLTATVDGATGAFLTCSAVPRVLPFVECPVAAASADRLVGQPIEATRDYVRRELRGTSTCTHLNDLLRSLGDVGALAALSERSTSDDRHENEEMNATRNTTDLIERRGDGVVVVTGTRSSAGRRRIHLTASNSYAMI